MALLAGWGYSNPCVNGFSGGHYAMDGKLWDSRWPAMNIAGYGIRAQHGWKVLSRKPVFHRSCATTLHWPPSRRQSQKHAVQAGTITHATVQKRHRVTHLPNTVAKSLLHTPVSNVAVLTPDVLLLGLGGYADLYPGILFAALSYGGVRFTPISTSCAGMYWPSCWMESKGWFVT